MANKRFERVKDDEHWDGGCSKEFRTAVLNLLAGMYGPRKLEGKKVIKDGTPMGNDVAFLHVINGPLGSVEFEYRRLVPVKLLPANVEPPEEKIAGVDSTQFSKFGR